MHDTRNRTYRDEIRLEAAPALVYRKFSIPKLDDVNPKSVELATLEWVAWFNHKRLHSSTGYIPPAEAGANYYNLLGTSAGEAVLL